MMTTFSSWTVEPPLVFVLALRRSSTGVGGRRQVSARRTGLERRGRAWRFYSGLLTIVVALDSPLDPLADQLFAAHMAQHVLLLTVAPPLIVLAAPWTRMWQPLPLGFRRSAAPDGRALPAAGLRCVRGPHASPVRSPPGCCSTRTSSLWHVPALYDATLRNAAVHELEHALFFFTGLLFWGAGVRLAARSTPRSTGSGESHT